MTQEDRPRVAHLFPAVVQAGREALLGVSCVRVRGGGGGGVVAGADVAAPAGVRRHEHRRAQSAAEHTRTLASLTQDKCSVWTLLFVKLFVPGLGRLRTATFYRSRQGRGAQRVGR